MACLNTGHSDLEQGLVDVGALQTAHGGRAAIKINAVQVSAAQAGIFQAGFTQRAFKKVHTGQISAAEVGFVKFTAFGHGGSELGVLRLHL